VFLGWVPDGTIHKAGKPSLPSIFPQVERQSCCGGGSQAIRRNVHKHFLPLLIELFNTLISMDILLSCPGKPRGRPSDTVKDDAVAAHSFLEKSVYEYFTPILAFQIDGGGNKLDYSVVGFTGGGSMG
jgi:hypothetical protein